MTANMINYRSLEETRRHNREMERLTGEQQAETARHQRVVEEETYRSNLANEAVKRQQNVINDNHYQRSDFETARHDAISEYYTMQYPTALGKPQAEVTKLQTDSTLNLAKAGESSAKGEEAKSRAGLNESTAFLNYSKAANIAADTLLKQAQYDKVIAETSLVETRDMYYPVESVTKSASNVGNTLRSLFGVLRFSTN